MSEKLTRKSQLRMAMERAKQNSGMTQEDADARYLQLSGGTLTGRLDFNVDHVFSGKTYSTPSDTLPVIMDITSLGTKTVGTNGTYYGLTPNVEFYAPGNMYFPGGYPRNMLIRGVATPTQSNDAANKQYVDQRLPAGSIILWLGTEAPTGWTLCDGSNGAPNLPAPDASVSYIMKL